MAPPKKQRAVEKIESSEDKIKSNALYFLQGRTIQLKTFDLPGWVESLKRLSDEEKLAAVQDLAQQHRTPKLSLLTAEGEDPDEGKLHRTMPLTGKDGVYTVTIPDFYARDGADKYLICDTIHYKRSFTKAVHDAWEEHREKHDLQTNLARQSEIRREVRAKIPTSEDIKASRAQLPELRKTQTALIKKQQEAYLDMEVTPEQLVQMDARLKLVTTRIKELEQELATWENSNDPFAQALETSELSKELQGLSDKTNLAFLEFMHWLSTEQSLTTETFEEWTARATADDYANAIEVVGEGNAFWTYGKVAEPLTRQQERKRELSKLLN